MINFVRTAFRGLFTVAIVISMIAVVIRGIVIQWKIDGMLGLLFIIAGLLVVVLSSGLIATILNIDENLETIKWNTSQTGNLSGLSLGNASPTISSET